jgi:hypothetical protein
VEERSREHEAEKKRESLLTALDSLRQVGQNRWKDERRGGGLEREQQERAGREWGYVDSHTFFKPRQSTFASAAATRGLGGPKSFLNAKAKVMEGFVARGGGRGGESEWKDIESTRQLAWEEDEGYEFQTADFQALQRRLEPLEVRAARLRAKQEHSEKGEQPCSHSGYHTERVQCCGHTSG